MAQQNPRPRINPMDFAALLRHHNIRRASDLLPSPPVSEPSAWQKDLEDVQDEPYQNLIAPMLQCIARPTLARFVQDILQEPEIRAALSAQVQIGPNHYGPIDALHGTVIMVRVWSTDMLAVRETMQVACILRGIQELLIPQIRGNSSPSDILITIVRKALYRLDRQDQLRANLLRLLLGWGNEDEIDVLYVPRLQQHMYWVLSLIGLLPSGQTDRTNRPVRRQNG